MKEFTNSKNSKLVIDCRTIILNLVSSILFDGMWVTYSRKKEDYKKCNDKNAWMKYDNMLFVTKQLEVMGFIFQKIGYFDIKNDWKNSTKMMPTYKFYQFCLQNKVDQMSFLSEIQVINTKRDELVFNAPKDSEYINGKQVKKSKSIDVNAKKKTQQIQRMINDVKRQNKLSENFQAKLNITEYEKYHLFKLFGYYDEILDTRCYRVFTDCVESAVFSRYIRYGGRWYCDCQNVPRQYRKHIEFSYDKGET